MAQRNLIGLDKQTHKQTLTIFNELITLSFRKANKNSLSNEFSMETIQDNLLSQKKKLILSYLM